MLQFPKKHQNSQSEAGFVNHFQKCQQFQFQKSTDLLISKRLSSLLKIHKKISVERILTKINFNPYNPRITASNDGKGKERWHGREINFCCCWYEIKFIPQNCQLYSIRYLKYSRQYQQIRLYWHSIRT